MIIFMTIKHILTCTVITVRSFLSLHACFEIEVKSVQLLHYLLWFKYGIFYCKEKLFFVASHKLDLCSSQLSGLFWADIIDFCVQKRVRISSDQTTGYLIMFKWTFIHVEVQEVHYILCKETEGNV